MSVTVTILGMNQNLGRPISASQTLEETDGETVVFTAPSTGSCLVTLSIANRAGGNQVLRLALSESPTAQSSDWLVYDTTLSPGGVVERTGLVLSPGNSLIASVVDTTPSYEFAYNQADWLVFDTQSDFMDLESTTSTGEEHIDAIEALFSPNDTCVMFEDGVEVERETLSNVQRISISAPATAYLRLTASDGVWNGSSSGSGTPQGTVIRFESQ